MARKIKRTANYQLSLEIENEQFIRPPRDAQRNWLLNRALKEAGDDLDALDELARDFVPGGEPANLSERTDTILGEDEIMEDWQIAVMREMAARVSGSDCDILEIGFGRGIASDFIQEGGARSHTIVECNQSVIDQHFDPWNANREERDIRLIRGRWQDSVDQFELYDGIFFHTYPLNESEFVEYVAQSATFAEHFFDTAAAHLRPGGRLTYLTNEFDSLSRSHQRALFKRFSSFRLSLLCDLKVPKCTRDAQWAQQTVIACATK